MHLSRQSQKYDIKRKEKSITFLCSLIASPSENLEFIWFSVNKFNEEEEITDSAINIYSQGTTSKLNIPMNLIYKFKEIHCRGKNEVGYQEKPCKLDLSSLGPPEPVTNCSLGNTKSSKNINEIQKEPKSKSKLPVVMVVCKENRDGGQPKMFRLQAFQKSVLIANMTR